MPEGWVDTDEDDGVPDEQHPEEEDECRPMDLLRMPVENLPQ